MIEAKNSLATILDTIDNVSTYSVLDVFAREGDWESNILASKCKTFEGWDINPIFVNKLRENIPTCNAHCRDSIEFFKTVENYTEFNILNIDNGLNCYGSKRQYCEHFDILPHISNFITNNSYVIFNVCRAPFNYNQFPDWKSRRNKFYNIDDSSYISLDFLINFYKEFFKSLGLKVNNISTHCREYHRDVDYLYHFCFNLIKE